MNKTKTIIYSCPFVPAEWIAAHQMPPCRIIPRSARSATNVNISFGLCPYARAFVHEVITAPQAKAAILTTTCDQMRRAADYITSQTPLPVFVMHIPATWQTAAPHKYYQAELNRLSRFLIDLGAKEPSNDALIQIMQHYDEARRSILAVQGRIPARQFSQALADFFRGEKPHLDINYTESTTDKIALALIGGPLMHQDFAIFDIVEKSGGHIDLDATTTGRRTLPAPFDRRRLREDPFQELCQAYFGTIPDAFRRPNSQLYQWLKQKLKETEVRAIIFHRYLWCDTWHAEVQRLKEWTPLPVLDLDGADHDENTAHRTTVRIQALLEMLR